MVELTSKTQTGAAIGDTFGDQAIAAVYPSDLYSWIPYDNGLRTVTGTAVTGTAQNPVINSLVDTNELAEGSTNLYFTEVRTLATIIAGHVANAGVVAPTNSILEALQKLDGNIQNIDLTALIDDIGIVANKVWSSEKTNQAINDAFAAFVGGSPALLDTWQEVVTQMQDNDSDIAVAITDIAANAAQSTLNAANITSLDARVTANEGQITAALSAISINAQAIAANAAAIQANADAIAALNDPAWQNPDDSPATSASTDIKHSGGIALDGLPQTSDKILLLAVDEVTGIVSKQAIPSSAAIGSSIENKLLVKNGDAGKSVAAIVFDPWAGSAIVPTIVLATDTGSANTMIIPLTDHGGIWVNGIFVGNTVKAQTEWLQLSLGDTLFVTGGFTGATMVGSESWAPIFHTGFGGKEFSIYVFRGAITSDPARLGILIGDQEAEIILQDWTGAEVYRATHDPLEVVNIDLDNQVNVNTQREWRLTSSADVTVGKMHSANSIKSDVSIIFPALAEPLIGHAKNGFVTSYDNLAGDVDIYMRDGVVGSGSVAFGLKFSINSFGSDVRLGLNGAGIIYPQNKVASYSGTDGDGGELVPFTPLSWLPNMVGFPRHNGLDRFSISARFEGNLYWYDDANTLLTTLPIVRTNTTDQRHPAATTLLSSDAIFGGVRPSYVIADMPIDVKINMCEPELSGPTSTNTTDTEETIVHGISTGGFVRPKFNPALNEWQVFNTATSTWVRG